ncbi:GP5 protein [Kafue kinda chacma baboon virus]|uniref:GP5 protein n=1 Tax=Kafue kinda chacma baboon virus TaxID=1823757 RepID=A0A120HVK6_9NIDO|nr:GP5 protein [Kafue kinda chacma baboon virus]AMB20718.1 GP5 protein [Kafue kinda chacma baboon virus]AMV49341.1 GP5 protein [Kafue kinda chacma baboon virus]
MRVCYKNWAASLMPSLITTSVLSFLLVSICVSPAASSGSGNFGLSRDNFGSIFKNLVTPSYVVNISICGALSMQNATHWFMPCDVAKLRVNCTNSSESESSDKEGCTSAIDKLSAHCSIHHYTGININHTKLALETYVAAPLLTHMLSYYFGTTAAFLDFLFFGGLSIAAYGYSSPAFLLYTPLAVIFMVVFCKKIILNFLALRFAWTRHTNFIIDQKGRLFVNHDDVLVEGPNGVRFGDQEVRIATVVLGGRKANLLRTAHAEEWSW